MIETYTVIGYWSDQDDPVSVGVIEGQHEVFGGQMSTEGGDWALSVQSWDPHDAEVVARNLMRATLDDDVQISSPF